jgi:hypothetical protein
MTDCLLPVASENATDTLPGHRLFAQKFEQISMYSVGTLLMKSVGSDGSGYLTAHS